MTVHPLEDGVNLDINEPWLVHLLDHDTVVFLFFDIIVNFGGKSGRYLSRELKIFGHLHNEHQGHQASGYRCLCREDLGWSFPEGEVLQNIPHHESPLRC